MSVPTGAVLSGDFWTQFVLVAVFGLALVGLGVEIAESGMDGPAAAVAEEVAVSHTKQADLVEDLLAERRARIQRFADRPQWLRRD